MGSSFSQIRWLIVAALAVIAAIFFNAVNFLRGEATIIKGNVDDFFIALNAGYVVSQEGLAHPSIHSPFGVVYFFLSSNSFRLIEHFPQWLSLDKIHMITSMQWMVIVSALFFAFWGLQDGRKRFELWLLALLLLICVQAKEVDVLSPLPNWFGTYNYHLWALLIVQAANHYCWKGAGPKGRAVAWLGVLEAAVLVISFNYKVSFFLSSCALGILPLFYLSGWKARAAYYGALLSSAAVMMAALAGSGVPFVHYIQDVIVVARAKSVATTIVLGQLCAALAYTYIVGKVEIQPDVATLAKPRMTAMTGAAAAFSRYAFHGLVAVAIAIASLGDFFAPWWPYVVLCLWAVVCSSKDVIAGTREPAGLWLVRDVSAVLVTVFAGFALLSLQIIADDANSGPTQSGAVVESISFAPRPLNFIHFPVSAGFDDLFASKLFAVPPDLPQKLFEYSYRSDFDRSRPIVQVLSILSAANYTRDINETVDWLNESGSAARGTLAISHLGFSNPWPLLTGNRFVDGSPHWLHLGTTVSPRQIDTYLDPMKTADVVVVPLIGVNNPEQVILDCAFYDWNIRNGESFVPQHLAGYNLIFVRKGGRLPVNVPEPVRMDTADIQKRCGDVLASARTSG